MGPDSRLRGSSSNPASCLVWESTKMAQGPGPLTHVGNSGEAPGFQFQPVWGANLQLEDLLLAPLLSFK